jgi:murein DD-endopeptidase MepM/ murein hydrolase activator NlpD
MSTRRRHARRAGWGSTRGRGFAARLSRALLAGFALVFVLPATGGTQPEQGVLGIVGSPGTAGSGSYRDESDVARISGLAEPAPDRAAGRPRVAPSDASPSDYRWPIAGARLTQPFGPTRWGTWIVNGEGFHDGIDLASFCGDRIRAAHGGVVLAAGRHFDQFLGWVGDLGPYTARLNEKHLWVTLPIVVVIEDGNGYRSIYAHFNRVVVKPGEAVAAGDLLGFEGSTGNATGCHLHYSVFSPDETATFGTDPKVVAHMLLPAEEIARIDPLLVLPPLAEAGIH